MEVILFFCFYFLLFTTEMRKAGENCSRVSWFEENISWVARLFFSFFSSHTHTHTHTHINILRDREREREREREKQTEKDMGTLRQKKLDK